MMNKEKSTIILTIGVPTSGKTTWSKEYVKENPDTIRFNRDDIRTMLKGEYVKMETEEEFIISRMSHTAIMNAIKYNKDIILDETNLKLKEIKKFVNEYKYYANISFKVFHISYEEALDRNSKRDIFINKDVFQKMFDRYKYISQNYNFEDVPYQKMSFSEKVKRYIKQKTKKINKLFY